MIAKAFFEICVVSINEIGFRPSYPPSYLQKTWYRFASPVDLVDFSHGRQP